jgi:hypothetical protein
LQAQDLQSIAQFKKIVHNYMSMKKALGDEWFIIRKSCCCLSLG